MHTGVKSGQRTLPRDDASVARQRPSATPSTRTTASCTTASSASVTQAASCGPASPDPPARPRRAPDTSVPAPAEGEWSSRVGASLSPAAAVHSGGVAPSFSYSMPTNAAAVRRACVQHSTAQHSTAQHSTAQHSTAQHSTAQHSTAQHGAQDACTLGGWVAVDVDRGGVGWVGRGD